MKLPTLKQAWRAVKKQSISSIGLALSLTMFAYDTVQPTEVPVGSLNTLGGATGTVSLSVIALFVLVVSIALIILARRKQ